MQCGQNREQRRLRFEALTTYLALCHMRKEDKRKAAADGGKGGGPEAAAKTQASRC